MLKDYALHYYEQGYNCAESLVYGANVAWHLNLDENACHLMAGLGGGLQVGDVCGALTGAVCALGCLIVKTKAHDWRGVKAFDAGSRRTSAPAAGIAALRGNQAAAVSAGAPVCGNGGKLCGYFGSSAAGCRLVAEAAGRRGRNGSLMLKIRTITKGDRSGRHF